MTKILYIIQADSSTGSGKCALSIIKCLNHSESYTPIVITQKPNDINDYCNKKHIENYAIHYARTCSLGMGVVGVFIALLMRPFLNYLALKKLKKHTNLHDIKIIHSNDSSIDFGAYLFRKINVPHIWHIREFLVFQKTLTPIIPNLPKYIDKYSTSIVTVSNALKEFLIKKNVTEEKIQTIYDGIEWGNNFISKGSSNKINIICLGAICKEKGQDVLIDALSSIPQEIIVNLKIDFFGNVNDQKFKNELDNIIIRKNLQDVVSFCGTTSNVSQVLQDYDIGIQPSHSEGFSLVTAEYMMAGLCVIAAEEGAIPELITHNETGFLYEDYNSSDLKDKILYCFYHQDIMKMFGEKAAAKAKGCFSIKKNLKDITQLYNEQIS